MIRITACSCCHSRLFDKYQQYIYNVFCMCQHTLGNIQLVGTLSQIAFTQVLSIEVYYPENALTNNIALYLYVAKPFCKHFRHCRVTNTMKQVIQKLISSYIVNHSGPEHCSENVCFSKRIESQPLIFWCGQWYPEHYCWFKKNDCMKNITKRSAWISNHQHIDIFFKMNGKQTNIKKLICLQSNIIEVQNTHEQYDSQLVQTSSNPLFPNGSIAGNVHRENPVLSSNTMRLRVVIGGSYCQDCSCIHGNGNELENRPPKH